ARFIRETNLLRCVQCLSVRPSDPLARFCAQCGAAAGPLAAHRRPPADGGQAVCCVICNTLVSVNTHTCLICEEPVHQQATHTLQDHVVCVSCGSGNPAHISSCLTCESRLQPPVCVEDSAPSVRSADSRMLSCSRCKRVNRRDARFCDWCGSKPGHAARCVICCRCGASGDPYAFFCTACGIFLEAPAPPTSYGDIRRPAAATPAHDVSSQATPSSGPAPRVRMTTPTAEQCTQTVGLYYPSSTELQRKEKQRARELSRQQAPRDGRQLLTAVSPGRGYWRRQLDHVCGHLRSYTQNNAPFRALLGEPRLGERPSVTEGTGSRSRSDQHHPAAPGSGTSLCSQSAAASGSPDSVDSDWSVCFPINHQGADPTCCGGDGRHALAVAVVNGHHDVLPVLVQRGADVDEQSGQMKNSALHEAAARGSEGLQCAKVLLSCKASVRRRNADGQTAYDVAVRSGCNNMVSLLAAQTGLDLLGKLGKPKLNLDVF
uniref:Double zinc ribbon and ankyrin repeat domains 1 n=1 Tax=Sparus aurata TaxID=8175 RepID=A0A671UFY2_SPAAU